MKSNLFTNCSQSEAILVLRGIVFIALQTCALFCLCLPPARAEDKPKVAIITVDSSKWESSGVSYPSRGKNFYSDLLVNTIESKLKGNPKIELIPNNVVHTLLNTRAVQDALMTGKRKGEDALKKVLLTSTNSPITFVTISNIQIPSTGRVASAYFLFHLSSYKPGDDFEFGGVKHLSFEKCESGMVKIDNYDKGLDSMAPSLLDTAADQLVDQINVLAYKFPRGPQTNSNIAGGFQNRSTNVESVAITSGAGAINQTETSSAPRNQTIADKWALIVGISKFRNSKYNLRFASKDALDFYNFLVNEANFKRDHVLLLLDDKATAENIKTAFGDKFLPAVAQPGDMVVVFVSTHGTPKSKDHGGRNYIVAYDTDVDRLYATGVDMDELYRRTKEAVKTERALIVMDTCYSGAGVPGAKAMNDGANFDAQEIAQGCGHLVITSSSPSERSWESKVSPNGVFTKYLLESLRQKNRKIDVKSAFLETQSKVSWEVKSAFSTSQTPQLGGEWEGKELILSVPASKPRQLFNPEILQMMQLRPVNSSTLHSAPPKLNKVRNSR